MIDYNYNRITELQKELILSGTSIHMPAMQGKRY